MIGQLQRIGLRDWKWRYVSHLQTLFYFAPTQWDLLSTGEGTLGLRGSGDATVREPNLPAACIHTGGTHQGKESVMDSQFSLYWAKIGIIHG